MSEAKVKSINFKAETANSIFAGNFLFKMPFFQRNYIWDERLWETLLESMEKISDPRNDEEHFMGFIILKRENNLPGVPYLVVDGQQRLTTFLLFAKAYSEITGKKRKNIKFRINKTPILEHNHHDKKIFEAILDGKTLTKKEENENSDSKVLQCFKHYSEKDLGKIDFKKVLEKLSFVYVILPESYEEQKIFDTMNSLLEPLSNADLLKNYLFDTKSGLKNAKKVYEKTWKKTFENNREIKKYWNHMISAGRYKQTILEMFLRSYLEIYETRENVQPPDKDEYKKHETLFERYKYVLENFVKNKEDFINEIMEYANEYKDHINHKYREHLTDIKSRTQRLNAIIFSLETTTIIPYMLYILKTVNDSQEIEKIFSTLESYLVRRFICGFSHKNYNKYFIRAIKSGRNSYDDLKEMIYGDIVAEKTRMPTNEILKEHFETKLFKNNAQARTIMHLLEHYATPKNTANPPLSLKDASLEHVMPKGWKENWHIKSKRKEEITIEREERKFWLGNMILIPEELNNYFGNASWHDKKEGTVTKSKKHKALEKKLKKEIDIGSLKTCCQNMVTFKKYLEDGRKDWNEKTIKQRNGELYELAKELWSYELPD